MKSVFGLGPRNHHSYLNLCTILSLMQKTYIILYYIILYYIILYYIILYYIILYYKYYFILYYIFYLT